MENTKDLHICGNCRTIFDNVELFVTHKAECNKHRQNQVESELTNQIILESEIFSSGDLFDETPAEVILEEGTIPLILQYENEEIVSDTCSSQFLIYNNYLNENLPIYSAQANKNMHGTEMDEEDIANLLITQLSKEVLRKNNALQTNECNDCNSTGVFSKDNADSVHLKKHTVESGLKFGKEATRGSVKKQDTFACSHCNFVPIFPRDLVRHMRKHTGERPYECNMCDKKFARQDKLEAHKRIHRGDKRYKCQLCPYATTDGPALRKHVRIHTDERPYKCQLCSYTSRTSSHMVIHLRTHTGDSPFFCQLETCGLTFKTSSDLKRHMYKHKQENLSSYSSFNDMSEKFCSKHLLKNGKLVNKQSCFICQDYVYEGPSNRKSVGSKKKKRCSWLVKAHKCPHCEAAFVRPDSLRSHMRLHQEETRLADKPVAQDESESDKEANYSGRKSSQSILPEDTITQVPELFCVDNVGCLQDSLIALGHDGSIQSIVNTSLL